MLVAPTVFFDGGLHASLLAGLVFAITGEAVLIGAIASHANMTAAIEESALYADLQPFGGFSPLDPHTVSEYRRRRKLAGRKMRFRMPAWSGHAALLAHAVISHVRRYDGIMSLILQGAVVVPMGVMALLDIGGPVMMLFWLQAVVMVPHGVRESTRVFRDDMRNRLVRDRLPFGTLELLVWDSIPAFAVTSVICSAVSALIAVASGAPVAYAVICAVLVNAALVLCGGLDAMRLFERAGRLCYEMGAVVLVVVAGACLLTGSLIFAMAGVIAVCVAVGATVRFGRECVG